MVLLSKKTIDKMGSQMGNSSASKPSAFAMKQMAKMGWVEGKGLGKSEDGIAKHIEIKKRDSSGLGSEVVDSAVEENWWHATYSSNLKSLKITSDKKKSKKSKKGKKDKGNSDYIGGDFDAAPSYEELFKATGGARLGMRSRSDQKGKIMRTENADSLFRVITDKSSASDQVVSAQDAENDRKAKKARRHSEQ